MELVLPFLVIAVLLFALAILTNLYREHRLTSFELTPNCLLTRHPVVFITGPRSLFYFRKYWNAYPEILAEHGYQVFTLQLPWQGPERVNKIKEFLTAQQAAAKKFHFICDPLTGEEFREAFKQFNVPLSVTILTNNPTTKAATKSFANPPAKATSYLLAFAYKLHSWRYHSLSLPSAEDLGLQEPNSGAWLLQEMQEKAEQDFLQGESPPL